MRCKEGESGNRPDAPQLTIIKQAHRLAKEKRNIMDETSRVKGRTHHSRERGRAQKWITAERRFGAQAHLHPIWCRNPNARSLTHMAAGDGSTQRTSSVAGQWSDLPHDLLAMVYLRHLYCPHDGTVLPRVLLPSKAAARCFIGGYDGGWVALSEWPLGIVNLFSGAQVPLPVEQRRIVRERGDLRKVIFSQAPTSSGCILAAITDKPGVAICKVGCPEKGWITQELRGHERLMDITFYNGELYGITRHGDRLVKNRRSRPYSDEYPKYIIVLDGKLLLVQRTLWEWPPNNMSFFRVDQLVHSDSNTRKRSYDYKWEDMTSLGDYALFLGPMCSKAMRVPTDGRGSLKRNHIYYSHHRCLRRKDQIPDGAKLFHASLDSNGDRVYYMEEESTGNNMEGIKSVRYYVRSDLHPPMWLLPPNI
uniref:KIB1-4 beta-propeller domain-containing protein n=1 Tax=Aegilops tauschii TaxID=37682 RepID=N1QZZ6_AEGTA